ncbi:hypothetical protein XBI1_1420053 [Xenorhabdus bovienii str. Intermedium]|uniref:Uncharacterized protein n=1 Tax=Xenorhabdus bovienii str. Intermedium TaxID=1379677 RepID=A0A077QE00_XENBV|nr:hypothetical protein XBI1_1420053 [Xenorhabdus bovienii str. Intermedium]
MSKVGFIPHYHTFRKYKSNVIPKGRLEKFRAIASLELG